MTTTDRTATSSTAVAPSARADPGFGATFRSEWRKFFTARAPRRNLVLGVVLGVALATLLASVVASTIDEWAPEQRAEFDPLLFGLSGSLFTAIFFVAAAVNPVASEYASGMIRLTFTATPRRGRVLAAKAAVVALATGLAGIVANLGMLLPAQAIFSSAGLSTVGFGDGELWRTVVALVLVTPVLPVLGVALTFVVRSTAAALSILLAVIFLPDMIGAVLPSWWQRNVLSMLPGPASDSIAIGHLTDSSIYLQPVAAVAVLIGWVVVLYGLAYVVLQRRDA